MPTYLFFIVFGLFVVIITANHWHRRRHGRTSLLPQLELSAPKTWARFSSMALLVLPGVIFVLSLFEVMMPSRWVAGSICLSIAAVHVLAIAYRHSQVRARPIA